MVRYVGNSIEGIAKTLVELEHAGRNDLCLELFKLLYGKSLYEDVFKGFTEKDFLGFNYNTYLIPRKNFKEQEHKSCFIEFYLGTEEEIFLTKEYLTNLIDGRNIYIEYPTFDTDKQELNAYFI